MTPRVQSAWAGRTAAEYRSAAVTTQTLHRWLMIGADPSLLLRLHRAIAEELDHSRRSRALFEEAGGDPSMIQIPAHALSLDVAPGAPLPEQTALAVLQEHVIHETLALALFRAMLDQPLHPNVRRCILAICEDEARHRAMGWALFDALPNTYAWIAPRLSAAIEGVMRGYPRGPEPDLEEQRWGLLPATVMAEALVAGERLVRRGLERRGFMGG